MIDHLLLFIVLLEVKIKDKREGKIENHEKQHVKGK